MLTESQISDRRSELAVAVVGAPAAGRGFVRQYVIGLAPFLAVLAQFGLVVMVVDYWQLENLSLVRLMQLAFVGFVIHHLLPLRFRLPFFAMLSVLSVTTGVGQLGPKEWVAWLSGRIT